VILVIPNTIMLAQSISGRILYGMAKHRTWAWILLIEGAGNVILSVFLVQHFGLLGDAFGTAIPMTCTMTMFLPRYMCRLLGIRIGPYLAEAFLLPLLLCLPLTAALIALQRWFVPHDYLHLLIQLLIAGIIYGAALLWAFKTKRLWHVRELPTRNDNELTLVVTNS
jgi:O-antigen/teichoic acid export membrane protein